MYVDSNQHKAHPELTPPDAIVRPMPIDYVVKDIKIEFKSSSDFLQSINDKRLWRQAEIADVFLIAWDCNEFLRHHPYKHAYSVMLGALSALLISFKKSVIFLPSAWMRDFIYNLASREEKTGSPPVFKRKAKNLPDAAVNMLLQIPQISSKGAEKICQKFNTLQEIANANEEEIKSLSLKTPAKENLYKIWRAPLK